MNKTMTCAPVAWLFPDIGMTTTHEDERDRWIAAGRTVLLLFTHPAPSQPSSEPHENFTARQIREHNSGKFDVHYVGTPTAIPTDAAMSIIKAGLENARSTFASQPSAEAIVQAALEAAIDALYKVSCECAARHAAIEEAAAAIRALSAQQIIESCKEKS